ncbi:MAG: hypothetical protein PHH59_08780 [Methylovulum sp.]|uniref:hypothetical protein n=1 Tax=Methylovulum sp. TaxID=1916980 RepID=UPI0026096F3A|nr:hypothetical protein [Methylovulum sp.]MDD2724097.1 hypothetical protein [Methylovulum sp.]MDD5124723.1 hypothetical protein [Methylovulum sp.]
MTITKMFKPMFLLALLLVFGTASAYSPEEKEVDCKKPKFTDFNLTPYDASKNIEVPAEAEFFIKISAYIDTTTIKLTAKGEPLPFKLESTSTFHKITAKLPVALNGQYARINVGAMAVLGCDNQTGWLVKIAKP